MMVLYCLSEDCITISPKDRKAIIAMRCRWGEPDLVNNEVCRGKLLLRLSLLSRNVKKISLLVQKGGSFAEYGSLTVRLLRDYSYRLSKLRKAFMKVWTKQHLDDLQHLQCRCLHSCTLYRSVADCKNHLSFFNDLGVAYTDPFAFYNSLRLAFLEANKVRCRDKRCVNALRSLLALSLKEIEGSQFISLLIKNNQGVLRDEVYKDVFRPLKIIKMIFLNDHFKGLQIKNYDVDIFNVNISCTSSLDYLYYVSLNLPYVLKYLCNVLIESISESVLDEIIKHDSLWDKICFLRDTFESLVHKKNLTHGDNHLAKKIALFSAYRALGVHKLMPFLLDKHIDEVYLDRPGTRVYLDHEEFGRCMSNITLCNGDVQRFIDHVLLESKLPLNYLNPSLKWNMRMDDFTIRVSIDIPPLSHEGPSLDLRKIKHKVYTIVDLFLNNVLSQEEAAFLILHVINRRNIIICGEPGTGKTTLMNALDLCTPKNWRKIYIEDVVESLDQRGQGRHQLRLYVEPFEVETKTRKKSVEIIKLLHRTPDWICLGELQSKEHFRALFHAIAAGLRGIHTCHASSVSGLIKRLVLHCGISKEDLSGIDLIVHMVKCYQGSKILRRVAEVWAVGVPKSASMGPSEVPLSLMFKWDSARDLHDIVFNDIFKSPSMLKLLELGNSYAMLKREYEELKALLKSLALNSPQDVECFAKAFDDFLQRLAKEGVYVI
jgi:type IV secretory pathway ATPase VirB11/archaellum biosynthesis ATPase